MGLLEEGTAEARRDAEITITGSFVTDLPISILENLLRQFGKEGKVVGRLRLLADGFVLKGELVVERPFGRI